MRPRRTLRARIAVGLLLYSLLLGGAILLHGYLTNERIESVVWRSLLSAELDRWMEHRRDQPDYPLPRTGTLVGYSLPLDGSPHAVPEPLQRLSPGVFNNVELDGRTVAVLVRDVDSERIFMTVEAAEIERNERSLFGWVVLSSGIGAVVLAALIYWLSGRLLRPVSEFAAYVDGLHPDLHQHRVTVHDDAGREVATIAAAMNRYLERLDAFIARERSFVDSVSHELRTPVAVIAGAAEVLSARADLPEAAHKTLRRIRYTVQDIDQLIATLLVLAREPSRLRESGESHQLSELLPPLVTDHAYLTHDKALEIELGAMAPSLLVAPGRIIRVAIGNLLRNAIEHSDRGTVRISVEPCGVVRIQDPGHGMSPEDIGRFYTAMARRGPDRAGSGVGLELIRRICEHVGWSLTLESTQGQGTLAVLDMRTSLQS